MDFNVTNFESVLSSTRSLAQNAAEYISSKQFASDPPRICGITPRKTIASQLKIRDFGDLMVTSHAF